MTQDKDKSTLWHTCRARDDDAVGITRGEGAALLAEVYGPMRRERAALIVSAVNQHAALLQCAEELGDVKTALLSDAPDGGAQKEIYPDHVIYRLDGQALSAALKKIDAALSALEQAQKEATNV